MDKKSTYRLLFVLVVLISFYGAIQFLSPEIKPSSKTPVLSADSIMITFAASEFDRRVYEPLISDFHQTHPNIVVEYVDFPSYLQPLDPHILTTLADTTILPLTPPAVARAYLNLSPLVEDDPDFNRDDFWPGILSACQTVDEYQTGIPLTASVRGIFYYKQAFENAGLAYPDHGWTWDEFRRLVIALASHSNTGPKYGFTDSLNFDHSILAALVNAHLVNSMGDFDVELLADDIQWYVDFVSRDAIYATWENNDYALAMENWQALFSDDARPAMWAGNLASPMPGTAFPSTKLAIMSEGFAPFPLYENDLFSIGTSPMWVQCVGISAGTANLHAAWEWVKFLSQNWVYDSSLIGGNLQVPARPSVANNFNYWENLPPGTEPAVRFALEHSWYGSHYPEDINTISEGLSNALRGNMDIFSALDLAKIQMESLPRATEIPAGREVSAQPVATPLPTLSADIAAVNFFFPSYDKGDQRELEELAAEFSQAHSQILVRISTDFRGIVGQESITTLANQFDCFIWNVPAWTIQSPDDLLNLSPLVDQEPVDFEMDYFENVLNVYKVDGNLYGLPAFSNAPILSYNAQLLRDKGLNPPVGDWTFEEFMDLASAAASLAESNPTYGYLYNIWDGMFFNSRAVKMADYSIYPAVAFFDAPETVQAFAWLADLKKSGVIFIYDQRNWVAVQNAMLSGQVAFWQSQIGRPEGPYFPAGTQPSYEIGIVPLPSLDDLNQSASWRQETGFYISRQSANAKACWAWIKFLSEKPIALAGIPARRSVAQSPAWKALVGIEEAAVYYTALAQGTLWDGQITDPIISSPLSSLWDQALIAILEGYESKQLLPEVQRKADAYLACIALIPASSGNASEFQNQVTACTQRAGIDIR